MKDQNSCSRKKLLCKGAAKVFRQSQSKKPKNKVIMQIVQLIIVLLIQATTITAKSTNKPTLSRKFLLQRISGYRRQQRASYEKLVY